MTMFLVVFQFNSIFVLFVHHTADPSCVQNLGVCDYKCTDLKTQEVNVSDNGNNEEERCVCSEQFFHDEDENTCRGIKEMYSLVICNGCHILQGNFASPYSSSVFS